MISSSGWQHAFRLLRFSRLSNRRWSRSPDCGPIDDRAPRGPEGLPSNLQGRTTTRAKTYRIEIHQPKIESRSCEDRGDCCQGPDTPTEPQQHVRVVDSWNTHSTQIRAEPPATKEAAILMTCRGVSSQARTARIVPVTSTATRIGSSRTYRRCSEIARLPEGNPHRTPRTQRALR